MFENILADLLRLEGVVEVGIISKDGLLIEGETRDRTLNVETVGAMVVAVYGTSQNASKEIFNDERVDIITVESPRGKIISMEAGENAVLAVVTEPKVNLGLLRLYMKKNAQKVASML